MGSTMCRASSKELELFRKKKQTHRGDLFRVEIGQTSHAQLLDVEEPCDTRISQTGRADLDEARCRLFGRHVRGITFLQQLRYRLSVGFVLRVLEKNNDINRIMVAGPLRLRRSRCERLSREQQVASS